MVLANDVLPELHVRIVAYREAEVDDEEVHDEQGEEPCCWDGGTAEFQGHGCFFFSSSLSLFSLFVICCSLEFLERW